MARRPLFWHLFPSYLLIALLPLLTLAWFVSRGMHDFCLDQAQEGLRIRAELVNEPIAEILASGQVTRVDSFCRDLSWEGSTYLRVILPTGQVVADSHSQQLPGLIENQSEHDEFIAALQTGGSEGVAYDKVLQEKMLYLAMPLHHQGTLVGVLRLSQRVAPINRIIKRVNYALGIGAAVLVAISIGLTLWVVYRLNLPVKKMKEAAERFAEGDLEARMPEGFAIEQANLASMLNAMARQLNRRIQTITSQRNKLEAVLSSMVEGVLAVDAEGRLLSINQAAADLLGVDPLVVQGRSIPEIVRHPELQQFVEETLSSNEPKEADIFFPEAGGRYYQLNGAGLPEWQGGYSGAVIVLNDMTRIRRLESLRRDFVANVSHELKTPITSVQGFVETLQEGAIEDPIQASRFLQIIARQADRLNAIVEDLLSLSRIEDDAEKGRITLKKQKVQPVLASAVDLAQDHGAAKKQIELKLVCDEALEARIKGPLLEQAVVNLINNAVKYSESGGCVEVEALGSDDQVHIQVRDYACGIAPEHLSRIFERFYVVDKARSRKLGGTGLGLAIVKHIAQAHSGSVSVESEVGHGSTFTIHLPRA